MPQLGAFRTTWLSPIVLIPAMVAMSLEPRNAWADASPASAKMDFRKEIAPLLQQHCLECHGADKAEGGLRLDTRKGLMAGGDSGAVVTPGKAMQSELLRRLLSEDADERMPLERNRLADEAITRIAEWIDGGAVWPDGYVVRSLRQVVEDAAASHWAFQPRTQTVPPDSDGGKTSSPIDRFIQARLRDAGLPPSAEADRVTLIRRATIDLIGLPPTPDQIDAFVADKRPDAFARVIDRLLASPHYGERWARPWMDLCHYADTDGYLTDQLRPVAWRYRQWLIDALNANMPYDQFAIEQIAGDLLSDSTIAQRMATGFLRQTLSNREGGADIEEFRVKQVVDRTQMVGAVWLGLSVGCARCHDHKYDPISQEEYFSLYACFNNADEVNIDAPLPDQAEAYYASREEYQLRRDALVEPQAREIETLQKRWEKKLLHAYRNPGEDHIWDRQYELLGLVWGGHLGEGQLEGTEIVKLPWGKRTKRQRDDLLDYFLKSGSVIDSEQFKLLKLSDLKSKLDALKGEFPKAARAMVMRASQTRRPDFVHVRGEFRDPGREVQPKTPAFLPPWSEDALPARLKLAQWLVSAEHPLTARVAVNRMWQEFFGQGLVETADDFGIRGSAPTHPQLLDWLASEFINSGWNVKEMHRRIVLSATYRQSSQYREDIAKADPENRLCGRQNSLRVSSDAVRDMGLAVSGLLWPVMGGPSVKPPQPERVTMEAFGYNDWKPSPAPDRHRRGVYTFVIRTAPFAQTTIFDGPNPNEICARRVRSNTPLQALVLLNDPVFYEMARAMSDRLMREGEQGDAKRLERALQLTVGRRPSKTENNLLREALARQRLRFHENPDAAREVCGDEKLEDADAAEKASWTNICSALLNLHEFITRD